MFIATLFTIVKTWKQLVSIDEWVFLILKYTHREEYYLAHKNKEILSFATICMDFKGLILIKINQTKTNNFYINYISNLKKKKKQKTKQNKKKHTHTQSIRTEQIGSCQRQELEWGWNE